MQVGADVFPVWRVAWFWSPEHSVPQNHACCMYYPKREKKNCSGMMD
jgi:hypothetical protein